MRRCDTPCHTAVRVHPMSQAPRPSQQPLPPRPRHPRRRRRRPPHLPHIGSDRRSSDGAKATGIDPWEPISGANWSTMVTSTTSVSKPSGGQTYQIDVALGTLDDLDSKPVRHRRVVSGHQRRLREYLCLAPLLVRWQFRRALRCGRGYGTGTYTLTVSLIIDDHGDSAGGRHRDTSGSRSWGELSTMVTSTTSVSKPRRDGATK